MVKPTFQSALQKEIHQVRPFASLGQEAALGILRTADVVRRGMAALLAPYGLSPQQYNALRIVRGAGEAGIPTLEIAARTVEHAPGITRLLDGLEGKGLVRRERCPSDRRQVLCHLTLAGAALLARLDAPVLAANAHVETLTGRELTTLLRLLDTIRAAAHGFAADEHTRTSRSRPGRRTKGDSR